jgi:uncharacterized protein involved in exopolysaccharide biosynthesis
MPDGNMMPEREVKPFADYIHVLIRWRRVIYWNFIVIVVATAIVSLLLPKWYTSKGSILPTEADAGAGGLMAIVETALPLLKLPRMPGSSETGLGVLLSRTVAEDVIRENDLQTVYRADTIDEALETLGRRSEVSLDENGVVTIEVEARDPERAANMVRSYIEALERYNAYARTTAARRTREFAESRLEATLVEMTEAEESLAAFQREHGGVGLDQQAQAAVAAYAELEAEAAKAEIELEVARNYARSGHPEVLRLETKVNEYRESLDELRSGRGISGDADSESVVLPALSTLPDLAMEYARLVRDVEVGNALYLFLVQQYEAARLQEAKDTPTVQVLDWPVPAELRTRPRRTAMVVIAGIIGLIVGAAVALFLEFLSTSDETNPGRRTLDAAVSAFRLDLARLRGRGRASPPGDA